MLFSAYALQPTKFVQRNQNYYIDLAYFNNNY